MSIFDGEPEYGGYEPKDIYKSRETEIRELIDDYIDHYEGKDNWWQKLSDLCVNVGIRNLPRELDEQCQEMYDIENMNAIQLFNKYGYCWFSNLVNLGYRSDEEIIDAVLLGEMTLDEVEKECGYKSTGSANEVKVYEMAKAAKEALENAESNTIAQSGYFGLFSEYGYDRFKAKYDQGFFAGSEDSQLLASILLGYENLSAFEEKYGTNHELYSAAVRASKLYNEYINGKTKKEDSPSL